MADNVELLKRLDPAGYFEQFLAEGLYPDGRELTQFRHTIIECGGHSAAHQSSAYVHQGGAYVSCTVQLSLAPDADDPPINLEMEAMDAVPKDLLDHAQAHLRTIFAKNYLVSGDALRVSAESVATGNDGKRTTVKRFALRWTIHLKITVMSWDGFMLDTILTAVQAALLDTRVPTRVEYADLGAAGTLFADDDEFLLGEEVPLQFDIEKVRIVDSERECKPLELNQVLVYVPFLLYKSAKCEAEDERIILADPPADLCKLFKEDRCEMIIGPGGQLHSCTCSISNVGVIAQSALDEMMLLAQRRHTAVSNALKKFIKDAEVDGKGK